MDRHFHTLNLDLNINLKNKFNYDDPEYSIILDIQNTSHLMLKFTEYGAILFDSMDDSENAIYTLAKLNTLTNSDMWNLVGKETIALGLNSEGYFTNTVDEIVSPPLVVGLNTISPIL